MMSRLESSDGIDRVTVLVDIAHHFIHNEEWAKAILHYQSALDYIENFTISISQEELGKIRGGISYSLWKQGDFDQALTEAVLSTEILTIANSKYLLSAKRHLAVVLIEKQKCEEAIKIFEEITTLSNYDDDEIDLAKDNYHIGTALKGLADYSSATTKILQAKEIYEKNHLIWMIMLCDLELTFNYFKLGNFGQSLKCGLNAFEAALFLESFEKAIDASLLIAEVYSSQSDNDRALFHLCSTKALYLKNGAEISSQLLIKLDRQIALLLESEGKYEQANEIRQRINNILRLTCSQ